MQKLSCLLRNDCVIPLTKVCFEHLLLYLITQKAQRTYSRVLEGADVGALWSYVAEETVVPGETIGQATNILPHDDAENRTWVAAMTSESFIPCTIQVL